MTLYPGTRYEYSRSGADLVFTAGACPLGVAVLGYDGYLVEIEAIARRSAAARP
jgi:hypothetical protein